MSIADLEARLHAFSLRQPSLGAQLAANLARSDERIQRSAHAGAEARREAFRKWATRVRDHIAFAIACGVNPDQTCLFEHVSYALLEIAQGKSDNQDIWDGLISWAKGQGLALEIQLRFGKNGRNTQVIGVSVIHL